MATMAEETTNRASDRPSSPTPHATQPVQSSGEPDNESQYGGGRLVGMPREQNRDTANPPKASEEEAPANSGRAHNSSGPSVAS